MYTEPQSSAADKSHFAIDMSGTARIRSFSNLPPGSPNNSVHVSVNSLSSQDLNRLGNTEATTARKMNGRTTKSKPLRLVER